MHLRLVPITLAAALLAGCASQRPAPRGAGDSAGTPTSPPSTTSQPGTAAAPAPRSDSIWSIFTPSPPPPPSPLAGEQRWMEQLFDGTPVQVAGEADGSVLVEVPIAFAFDGQASAPKPPMRAVLDKITLAMLRQPRASLQIGPPGPAARERLAAMRSHLAGKGIAAPRLVATAPRQVDMVLLRLSPPPPTPPQAAGSLPAPGAQVR